MSYRKRYNYWYQKAIQEPVGSKKRAVYFNRSEFYNTLYYIVCDHLVTWHKVWEDRAA